MASGDTIFILDPASSIAPTTGGATLDTVADTSTPPIVIPVIDFDGTTSEHRDWHVTCPSNYAGGGFTISWKGGTNNTSTGTLELEIRILKISDADILTNDLGIDGQTEASITDTPPATPANKLNYSTTATLSHANARSPAPGDRLVIRATRDTATDTNTGDLQLAEILILET